MTVDHQLEMTQGPRPGQTFPLDKDTLIVGRDPRNDVVVEHPQVSRRHARLDRQGDLVVLEDLASTNGTFVNGTRLAGPHTLENGDVIGLGEVVVLTYQRKVAAEADTEVHRPTVPSSPPPPPPVREQPPPRPAYAPEPAGPPAYQAPSAPPPPQAERGRDLTWLWLGLGCLVLLLIAACAAVFLLDYLGVLPSFFYEPLRWLGLI